MPFYSPKCVEGEFSEVRKEWLNRDHDLPRKGLYWRASEGVTPLRLFEKEPLLLSEPGRPRKPRKRTRPGAQCSVFPPCAWFAPAPGASAPPPGPTGRRPSAGLDQPR